MTMKTIKVVEATERQLNWLVARIEGDELPKSGGKGLGYSSDWACGGPILERIKGLEFKHWLESKPESCCEVHIHNYEGDWVAFGPTPLIAVMRYYVASKLGREVEVPEELS